MGKARIKRRRLPGLLLLAALAAGLWGLFGPYLFSHGRGDSPEDRFLRAVYLLQRLGGPAAEERVDIPRRIRVSDATESLAHHPDTIFVLRSLADDLAALASGGMDQALLFEAYARIGLGESEAAGKLLARYVAERPYEERHYARLCSLLEETGDYQSLLLISTEWRDRDPVCRENRLIFTWLALCRTGRLPEAGQLLERWGACLGWRRYLYAARTSLAAGRTGEADRLRNMAKDSREASPEAVEALWQRLLRIDLPEAPAPIPG
jgi:tetratricopeptide (TPR) repeat protein